MKMDIIHLWLHVTRGVRPVLRVKLLKNRVI